MQVQAWGNSQGIRIPKDILQEANIEINDVLDLTIRGFSRVDRISMADIINITDAIQGIFDYV